MVPAVMSMRKHTNWPRGSIIRTLFINNTSNFEAETIMDLINCLRQIWTGKWEDA